MVALSDEGSDWWRVWLMMGLASIDSVWWVVLAGGGSGWWWLWLMADLADGESCWRRVCLVVGLVYEWSG